MSIVTLTKWGNSAGIRIPAHALQAIGAYVGEKFELVVNKKGGVTLNPLKQPQQGWKQAFNAAADAGHDKLLIEDNIESDFDKDEWTW